MFITILVLILVAVIAVNAYVNIKTNWFAFGKILGKRTGKVIFEGPHLRIPFIETFDAFPLGLQSMPVQVTFTSNDKLGLTVKGVLQFRPDPTIRDRNGLPVYGSNAPEVVQSGIENYVQAKLGALGGVKVSGEFIQNRQAVADLINCFLRMSLPPHRNHSKDACGVAKCALPAEINAEDVLDFYKKHWRSVKRELDGEKNAAGDHSEVETRYGLDIETYILSSVDFSAETAKAFETEKQAEARGKGFDNVLAMAKRAEVELGATPQLALNAARGMDPAVKTTVVSVEGEAGVLGALLASLGKKGA